jgi:hypothetical protein
MKYWVVFVAMIWGGVQAQGLETVQGSVVDIRRLKPTKTSEGGIEIMIHSQENEYRVLVGPAWQKRFDDQGIGLGDEVMVVGITFSLPGKGRGLRAQEIRRASEAK